MYASKAGTSPVLTCKKQKQYRSCEGAKWGTSGCRVCPSPNSVKGGKREADGDAEGKYPLGSTVRTSCDNGKTLSGPMEIKCIVEKGGNKVRWSHDPAHTSCDPLPTTLMSSNVDDLNDEAGGIDNEAGQEAADAITQGKQVPSASEANAAKSSAGNLNNADASATVNNAPTTTLFLETRTRSGAAAAVFMEMEVKTGARASIIQVMEIS